MDANIKDSIENSILHESNGRSVIKSNKGVNVKEKKCRGSHELSVCHSTKGRKE